VVRGSNMAEVISPVSEGRTSPLGDVSLLLAVIIFLELGGVGYVATALARSYEAVPLAPAARGASVLTPAVALIIEASGKILDAALGLAAPAVVSLLLADLALGAIARSAPQVPVYFAAMPLKTLLGVGMLLVGLGAFEGAIVAGFRGWAVIVERGFSLWR